MKTVPQRTCMGCNQKKEKRELIRIIKNKEGKIFIDQRGNMDGRGAYICNSKECLEKIIKSKRVEKVLEREIPKEIYSELKEIIINDKKEN